MSRVIKTESSSSLRKKLLREIATAMQEGRNPALEMQAFRDILAYVVMALEEINLTVNQTTTAWEKRGYWLKADRFRLEWQWAKQSSEAIAERLQAGQYLEAFPILAELATHMEGVQPKKRGSKDNWKGAWAKYQVRS